MWILRVETDGTPEKTFRMLPFPGRRTRGPFTGSSCPSPRRLLV